MASRLESLITERYEVHLRAAAEWLLRSIDKKTGGSRAYFTPLKGWSAPYPETTGYIIPTWLNLARYLDEPVYENAAMRAGEWLMSIQDTDGAWPGGVFKVGSRRNPQSVFNTGQILKGMVALYRHTGNSGWLDAALKAAVWLAKNVQDNGLWPGRDFRSDVTPSYYTHVAWPMLEVWSETGEHVLRTAAERFLRMVLGRIQPDGYVALSGFSLDKSAVTHTIAYTLRGFLEAARILDLWETYGSPATHALERLWRTAELQNGRLPGSYLPEWKTNKSYSCLTGNLQVAICLLIWEQRVGDLRLVNGAAKLVDYVCATQWLISPVSGVRGGVAGSKPLWGAYMFMRYPNWAAKYHCDAILRLVFRLRKLKIAQ